MLFRLLAARARTLDLRGRVVVITGGSRGLGLALARRFGAEGAKLAICARNRAELQAAHADLSARGIDVLAARCDVGSEDQVRHFLQSAVAHFGGIDVLVNDASIILAAPVDALAREDFARVMDSNFWGTLHASYAALEHLRPGGRIVNITSIGGAVAVPHLLPYTAAKFAAEGFSEGLHAELAARGIRVVSVLPGLMRTGSFLNAFVKGNRAAEFRWFALSSTLPLLTINAERAAARIVKACRRGEAIVVVGVPAKML
ncbi:MAG: SDR family oxidoreductase, partial [Deltaproteobacteria bacterium]|nr:SDR family oxidoreductase [Deltaproteobacteria bacterium]